MAAAFRDNLVSSVCPCAVVGYVGCEERFGVGLFIVAAMRIALHMRIDGRARIAVVDGLDSRYTMWPSRQFPGE